MKVRYIGLALVLACFFYVEASPSTEPRFLQKREDDKHQEKMKEIGSRLRQAQDPLRSIAAGMNSLASASKSAYSIVHKFQKILGVLGPIAMVASIALSVVSAFFPQQDSAELSYMKEKFDIVINGISRIEDKITDLQNVVIHENTKTAYSEYQRTILNLYEDWNFTINARTPQQEEKNRAFFVQQYNLHYKHAALNLVRAMSGYFDGELNNDLLKASRDRYKCDGLRLRKLCASVTQTVIQGIALEGAYYGYVQNFDSFEAVKERWDQRLELLSKKCEEIVQECRANWRDHAEPVVNSVYEQFKGSSNDALAKQTFNTLSNTFGHRAWFVFVYDHVLSYTYHGYAAEPSLVFRRWRENDKMFTVISFDLESQPEFDNKHGVGERLAYIRDSKMACIVEPPADSAKEPGEALLDAATLSGSHQGLATYVVKAGLHLAFSGTPDRYVRVSIGMPRCPVYHKYNFDMYSMG